MSGFLLDTNVVSDPSKVMPNAGLQAWFAAASEETLFLSVVTIGEIRRGVEMIANPTTKAMFETFLAALRTRFAHRLLAFDDAVAERWGRLLGTLAVKGVKLPAIDSLIAATALHHDLVVVTRNDADFSRAGIPVLNPFS